MSKEKAQAFFKKKKEKVQSLLRDKPEPGHKNTFTTKYRYAVPTGSGGRWNSRQASGPNQISEWKPVSTNKTGGADYERLKIVGDPTGLGSTGRTVSESKYDKLFGPGGKYEPDGAGTGWPGTGNRISIPETIGKKYKGSKR